MASELLTYEADGLTMRGHLYQDPSKPGKRPGILVFPEASGIGEHSKSRAERLAALGYAALACDLYGEGHHFTDMPTVMGMLGPLRGNVNAIRARASGALKALSARPEVDTTRIAAIGYCFGGTMSLELARSGAPIAGAVGFHSGLTTPAPQNAHQIKGKVLVCIGADDPGIDAAQRTAFEAEMREGKVDWQMNLYGGVVHSFTNPAAAAMGRPDFARYDAKADARSWSEMHAFFNEIFGQA
jgi:dienelactone hydrolase